MTPEFDHESDSEIVSDDQLTAIAGYIYDVATGEEESIQYPGTQLDSIQFFRKPDGTIERHSEEHIEGVIQKTRHREISYKDGEIIELSVNDDRINMQVQGYKITRTVYPSGAHPDDAYPYQIAGKEEFKDWAVALINNPLSIGEKDDINQLLGETETVESVVERLVKTEVITEESRVVYSPAMIQNVLEVSADTIEAVMDGLDCDSIVNVTVKQLSFDTDEEYVVSDDPFYGHTAVVSEGEVLEGNKKDFTPLDREVVNTVEKITVDVDDLMAVLMNRLLELPRGVERYAYLVLTPPAREEITAENREFASREVTNNGEIAVGARDFIDESTTSVDWEEMTEELIHSKVSDPEDHELYWEYLTDTSLLETITLKEGTEEELSADVEYTGETEYRLPGSQG